MARLSGVDVQSISLVHKAANKKRFAIFKSEEQPMAATVKNVLKNAFAGLFAATPVPAVAGTVPVAPVLSAVEKSFGDTDIAYPQTALPMNDPVDFETEMALNKFQDDWWLMSSALRASISSIATSKATNRGELIAETCAQFTSALMDGLSILKTDDNAVSFVQDKAKFLESIQKSGRMISADNEAKLKAAAKTALEVHQQINDLFVTNDDANTDGKNPAALPGGSPVLKNEEETPEMSKEIMDALTSMRDQLTADLREVKKHVGLPVAKTAEELEVEVQDLKAQLVAKTAAVEVTATPAPVATATVKKAAPVTPAAPAVSAETALILKSLNGLGARIAAIEESSGMPLSLQDGEEDLQAIAKSGEGGVWAGSAFTDGL